MKLKELRFVLVGNETYKVKDFENDYKVVGSINADYGRFDLHNLNEKYNYWEVLFFDIELKDIIIREVK